MQDRIKLASKESCTGCAACASICPKGCIKMVEDREGFLQPKIDSKVCVGCRQCEKTCPILNPPTIPSDFETKAYAAINKDEEIRMRSSSGGMFHALAKWTIEHGGVVFGARFDEKWEVMHDYTETIEGIEPFMRSKYVQSRVGDTFKQAKQFLEQDRWVLFSGTPCQIGGLQAFLGKEYERLILVDLICHGVPSPAVWREYLKDYVKEGKILSINFRDKKDGWLRFQNVTTTTTTTIREEQMENPYFRGFLKNAYLRKSCYNCQFRTYHRVSDITLADYWGVHELCPEMFDDNGTSILFVHTEKGNNLITELHSNIHKKPQSKVQAIKFNQGMVNNELMPENRSRFFALNRVFSFRVIQYSTYKDRFCVRVTRKMKKWIGMLLR